MFGSLLHIADIFFGTLIKTIQMMLGMIAYRMTFFQNAAEQFGIPDHIFAHTEERSGCSMFGQAVEHEGSGFRLRPVIEGEVNGTLAGRQAPDCFRINPPQPKGRMNQIPHRANYG